MILRDALGVDGLSITARDMNSLKVEENMG